MVDAMVESPDVKSEIFSYGKKVLPMHNIPTLDPKVQWLGSSSVAMVEVAVVGLKSDKLLIVPLPHHCCRTLAI